MSYDSWKLQSPFENYSKNCNRCREEIIKYKDKYICPECDKDITCPKCLHEDIGYYDQEKYICEECGEEFEEIFDNIKRQTPLKIAYTLKINLKAEIENFYDQKSNLTSIKLKVIDIENLQDKIIDIVKHFDYGKDFITWNIDGNTINIYPAKKERGKKQLRWF